MIGLIVQTGRQQRALYLRWNGWCYSHAQIKGLERALVVPVGDYHYVRAQYSRFKGRIRCVKRAS